jgi:hypothetical protein
MHAASRLLTVGIVTIIASCRNDSVVDATETFGAKQFELASNRSRDIGEDCSEFAESICVSALCVHYRSDRPERGYVCSRPCVGESNCPAEWHCVSFAPGPGNSVCMPPRDWEPKVAKPRAEKRSAN